MWLLCVETQHLQSVIQLATTYTTYVRGGCWMFYISHSLSWIDTVWWWYWSSCWEVSGQVYNMIIYFIRIHQFHCSAVFFVCFCFILGFFLIVDWSMCTFPNEYLICQLLLFRKSLYSILSLSTEIIKLALIRDSFLCSILSRVS